MVIAIGILFHIEFFWLERQYKCKVLKLKTNTYTSNIVTILVFVYLFICYRQSKHILS